MNKGRKLFIIVIFTLSIFILISSILKYNNELKINKDYKQKIINIKENITNLTSEENTLKEEIEILENNNNNNEKVKLYNKWINQEKELKEKIN